MEGIRQEFQLKNFGFGGVPDRLFAIPQSRWYFQPITWIIYRFAVSIYTMFWLILILFYWGEPPYYNPPADTKAKWLIYVSNWSYLILCLYFLTSSVGTLVYHINTKFKVSSMTPDSDSAGEVLHLSHVGGETREGANGYHNTGHDIDELHGENTPDHGKDSKQNQDAFSGTRESNNSLVWYFKVTWLLQNVAFTAALFVTLLFWTIDFDPETGVVSIFTVHIHGVNLFFVLLDQFLIATPYRLLHFIYPSLISLVFFIFTAVYYAAGGLNEYPDDPVNGNTYLYKGVLDWERATVTSVIVMFVVVLVATPILHLLLFAFYQLRLTFKRCCACCTGVEQSNETDIA